MGLGSFRLQDVQRLLSALHVLRNSGDSAILMEYAFCYPKQRYTYIRRIDRDGGIVDIMNLNT
jgi:hypothetical protein